ncbi:glycosyltransferase family 4 protein [Schlesneria sp. T3-172]|uniref:glycosyltransferase family 4 protein n=1 Tax=Schlesneria sphaerica TaxID=3373610 RepID=UPI0037CC7B63
MHIALIRRFCSLKKAGAERYCVNLFRGLQKLGHQVTVIGEGIDDELRNEVEFVPIHVDRMTSWTRNLSFSANCAKFVRSRPFDIVHGLSRVEGLDTFRLTDPMQTHWVKVWYRNPVSQWFQQLNPRHRAIFELERKLYGPTGVRRVIVQSKLDARLLTQYFGIDESRIRHIVNGVDTSVFHPGVRFERDAVRSELFGQFPSAASGQAGNDARETGADVQQDDTPLIIFASMDFRRKGLDSLLAALAKTKNRDIRLAVLGAGDIEGYRRIARSLGIEQRVYFAGRQSSIARFYGAGDLFVLPTVYEPFPNVNLEAMACGTPVITTATAGGADIIQVGRNGYVIPDAWSVQELTEQIDHFFALPSNVRIAMSDACWQVASRLKVEDNARQVVQLFEEVLREKNAG